MSGTACIMSEESVLRHWVTVLYDDHGLEINYWWGLTTSAGQIVGTMNVGCELGNDIEVSRLTW